MLKSVACADNPILVVMPVLLKPSPFLHRAEKYCGNVDNIVDQTFVIWSSLIHARLIAADR